MQRRKNKLDLFVQTRAFCLLFSVAIGFLSIMGCLFLFSIVVSKVDVPDTALAVLSTISLCVGAYFGGLSCGKKQRKNGLLMGVLTGGVMFVIIFFLSLLFAKTAMSLSGLSKLFWAIFFSAVGGIVGVNSKQHKY